MERRTRVLLVISGLMVGVVAAAMLTTAAVLGGMSVTDLMTHWGVGLALVAVALVFGSTYPG